MMSFDRLMNCDNIIVIE